MLTQITNWLRSIFSDKALPLITEVKEASSLAEDVIGKVKAVTSKVETVVEQVAPTTPPIKANTEHSGSKRRRGRKPKKQA